MRHDRWRRSPSTARRRPPASPGRSRSRSGCRPGARPRVTLTTVVEPSRSGLSSMPRVAGDDGEEAIRRQHRASDHAQAVAERAAGRQPQQLGRDQRPVDAEQARDLVAGRCRGRRPRRSSRPRSRRPRRAAPVSSALSASSFRTSRRSLSCGHASLLLQPLDGAEGGPVGALEFQDFERRLSLLKRLSDFETCSFPSAGL